MTEELQKLILRTESIKGLPFYFARVLPKKYRDEFIIMAQTKCFTGSLLPFLVIFTHKSIKHHIDGFNWENMIDIEAKKLGKVYAVEALKKECSDE